MVGDVLTLSSGINTHPDRYHSHVGLQTLTAAGPIIVDEKDWRSPVKYDEDLVMVLQDYYHVRLALFYPSLTSPLPSMAYHTFPCRLTLRRTTARLKPGC